MKIAVRNIIERVFIESLLLNMMTIQYTIKFALYLGVLQSGKVRYSPISIQKTAEYNWNYGAPRASR